MTTTTFRGDAAITRYLPPTNHRGARIVARCGSIRVVHPYPYELGPGTLAHMPAAREALARYWGRDVDGDLDAYGGPEDGYIFVEVTR